MTFDEGAAACRAQKLGTSACLALLEPLCNGNPTATFNPDGPTIYKCANPISTAQAAVLLKEALAARVSASPNLVPLAVVGVLALGLGAYALMGR